MSRITEVLGIILLLAIAILGLDHYRQAQKIESLQAKATSAEATTAAAKVHEPLVVAAAKKKEQKHAQLEAAAVANPEAADAVVPDSLADLLRAPADKAK